MTSGGHTAGRVPTVVDILAGDRRALAAAITLIESTREEDREPAEALLQALLPHAGKAVRLGISGAPGVGKSTFIEAFGTRAIAAGRRLAVLAIDPSSERSGGSILGDKTRMPELARSEESFVRASPAGGTLGGVARRTRDVMIACEAAGFDLVMVETVGVGQSEAAVADMVDLFMLLVQPGAGDELQGIKRGVSGARRYRRRHQGRRRAGRSGRPRQGRLRGCALAPCRRGTVDAMRDRLLIHRGPRPRRDRGCGGTAPGDDGRGGHAGGQTGHPGERMALARGRGLADRSAPCRREACTAVEALEAEVTAQTLTAAGAARRIVRRILARGD